ncbi:MAG: SGNH/GDSL hydrolase family protein [Armatimonadota bacterium]
MKTSFIEKLQQGQKQTLVAYGTSLTCGAWVQQLTDALEPINPCAVHVINSGMGAMHSDWGVDNFRNRVLAHDPDAVFIEFSINDAFVPYRISADKSRKNLEWMLDTLAREHPACEAILMTMNIPLFEHAKQRPQIEEYYEVYREVARARSLRLIDHFVMWKKILDNYPDNYRLYVPDSIHPNALGSARVTTPGIIESIMGELP